MAEKKSVRDLQNEVRAEEKKMQEYGKKFHTSVNGLKNDWKKHRKQLEEAATQMRNQGINKMKEKVKKFENEILSQKKENQVAISRMEGDVRLFLSQVDGKRKDFKSYAKGQFANSVKAFNSAVNKKKQGYESYTKGPFAGYIKAFWG